MKENCDYLDYSLTMDLPPYAAEIFLFDDAPKREKKSPAAEKSRKAAAGKSTRKENKA